MRKGTILCTFWTMFYCPSTRYFQQNSRRHQAKRCRGWMDGSHKRWQSQVPNIPDGWTTILIQKWISDHSTGSQSDHSTTSQLAVSLIQLDRKKKISKMASDAQHWDSNPGCAEAEYASPVVTTHTRVRAIRLISGDDS